MFYSYVRYVSLPERSTSEMILQALSSWIPEISPVLCWVKTLRHNMPGMPEPWAMKNRPRIQSHRPGWVSRKCFDWLSYKDIQISPRVQLNLIWSPINSHTNPMKKSPLQHDIPIGDSFLIYIPNIILLQLYCHSPHINGLVWANLNQKPWIVPWNQGFRLHVSLTNQTIGYQVSIQSHEILTVDA